MKILKIIGIVIAVAVAVLIGIGLFTPADYNFSRSVVIQSTPQNIFYTISHFSEFPKWSPWQELDPNMKTSLDGTDGTVGARYNWVGNDKAGSGDMTITDLKPNEYLEQTLHFIKPFESSATTYYKIEAAEGGQKVSWGMKGTNGFVARIFMTLMGGIENAVGKDYDKGLAALKKLCESAPAYEVATVEWPGKNCLSIRKEVSFEEIPQFLGTHYGKMYEAITKAGAQPGIPLAVYYKYDEQNKRCELAAAIPYEGKSVKAEGYTALNLEAGSCYLIDYFGNYGDAMMPAYNAMNEKLRSLNRENPDLVIEEYVTDPEMEKDTAKWNTKIYFFVK